MKAILALIAARATAVSIDASAATDKGTAPEAESLVKKAIAFYQKNGRDKALAEFSNTKGSFVDRDLYVTVYDMKGNCLAHINQRMVGRNFIDVRDTDGVHFLADRLEAAKTKDSGWQDYKYFNPVSKRVEPKSMYWQKSDGIVFAAGFYKQ